MTRHGAARCVLSGIRAVREQLCVGPTISERSPRRIRRKDTNVQHSLIFHICLPAVWTAAKHSEYRCPSLESEGFIHCSTLDQLVEVANYLFRGQRGLVLIVIDPDRVISPIRYEDAGNGELYPHIYGPLNPSAVVAVEPFELNVDGTFVLPKRLN